jgi:hypothetical protein
VFFSLESSVESFRKTLEITCEGLWTVQGQSIAKLVSLGIFSNGMSWKLFKEYKQWGVLHLLILSGSQFYSFVYAFEFLLRMLQRVFLKRSFPQITKVFLLPAAYIYLQTLSFSAPLVRCALLWISQELIRPYFKGTKILLILVFCVHLIVIENSTPSDSAFLSWLSFLTLLTVQKFLKHPLIQNLLISSLLQASICLIKGLPFSFLLFLRTMIANLILLPLYEKGVFPFVGLITALALLLCLLLPFNASYWISKVFIAPPTTLILDLLLSPLLVTHRAFRYTF